MKLPLPDQHAGLQRMLDTAEHFAYIFALQAAWPTLADALETDDALRTLQQQNPDYSAVIADAAAFVADLQAVSPALASRYDDLIGRRLSLAEDTALLFGLALGQRVKVGKAGA